MSDLIDSVDPNSGETVASHPVTSDAAVDAAIELAHARHLEWSRTSWEERSGLMESVADRLEERREILTALMASEMGKPVKEGRAEIDKCAWVCRYYAAEAEGHLADDHIGTEHRLSYVHYEPIGVVLAVMPWNFPFWQVFRFAAPALMAGNAGVLKHASNVTGSSLEIEALFEAAGAPPGLFASVVIPSSKVGRVIENPLIRAVTLTGSEDAGRAVAAKAGEMLKKTVLELGGSDPYLVLADADLDRAAAVCARSRLINAGQSCIAAKRFIVVDEVHDEFVTRLVDEMAARRVGDPALDDTDIGPMARSDLRDELHDQVERAVDDGATLALGGVRPEGPGAFYPATVLVDVRPGSVAATEEIFGPVAAVMRADDVEDAVAIANASTFGLGAAVFTADEALGEEVAARRLEAGSCFVNGLVASDPRLPFGGIKDSGYGRELSALGIREFCNAKTVVVAGE